MRIVKVVYPRECGVVKFNLRKDFTGLLDYCEVILVSCNIAHLSLVDTTRERWPIHFLGKGLEGLSDKVLLDLKLVFYLNLDLPLLLYEVNLFYYLGRVGQLLRLLVAWRKLCNLRLSHLALLHLLRWIILDLYCFSVL
jgi:hypothetical protein